MKVNLSKDWCMKMAQLEGDAEIGAGLAAFDPIFDDNVSNVAAVEEGGLAFSRFVQLARRSRGLTVEALAEKTDLELSEVLVIEENCNYKPDLRTVYQLANFFGVQRTNLLQIAGLTAPKNSNLINEAVRFAARSESVAVLTAEERAALEAFVSVLSEKK